MYHYVNAKKKLNQSQRGATENKPVSEIRGVLSQAETERKAQTPTFEWPSLVGRKCRPLGWAVHAYWHTRGEKFYKLPMSLHPTTPNWLRWSCGIRLLLWHGKNLNAAMSEKRVKRQQFLSLTSTHQFIFHSRTHISLLPTSKLNIITFYLTLFILLTEQ